MKESNIKYYSLSLWERARVRGFILLNLLLFVLVSCKQKTFDTEEALWEYIKEPNNGFIQEKKVGSIDYAIMYKPTDVLVAQEIREEYTKAAVDSLRNKYNKYLYFNVTMAKNNQEILTSKAGNRNEFGSLVNQLAFGMGEKVHVVSKERDTIEMADYIYPRLYGMGGATNMLFVYPRDEKLLNSDFFHFSIQDLGFATGEVGFKIPTDPIKNEPKLKFE